MRRYIAPPAAEKVLELFKVIENYEMPLHPFALAWVYSHPSVLSTVVGASTAGQLLENVQALNCLPLAVGLANALQEVNARHRDPTKGHFEMVTPREEVEDPAMIPWGIRWTTSEDPYGIAQDARNNRAEAEEEAAEALGLTEQARAESADGSGGGRGGGDAVATAYLEEDSFMEGGAGEEGTREKKGTRKAGRKAIKGRP
jgi:hypothetical protein